MGLNFGRNKKTIKDFVSEKILEKFVKQLPWMTDQLMGNEYKDICKLDQISKTQIKLKDGILNGAVFLKILTEHPKFSLGKYKYEFRLSSFYRTGLEAKKHKDRWPTFHVRKIMSKVAV